MSTMSNQIKALCRAANVKATSKKYGSTVTVTFLSPAPNSLIEAIRALETVKAHGDLIDDTRWYSGISIQFRYNWEPSVDEIAQFEAIKTEYADHGYWFKKAVTDRMGIAAGYNILDKRG